MSWLKIKELREKRKALAEQANEILKRADGPLEGEDEQRFDKIHEDIEKLGKQIEQLERQAVVDAQLAQAIQQARDDQGGEGEKRVVQEREAFQKYLRFGPSVLSPEERQVLLPPPELRALTVGTDSAGGYTVPEDFYASLIAALQDYGGVRQSRAQVIPTKGGNDLPIPTANDTSNKAQIVSEATSISATDISFGQVVLHAYTYRTLVTASLELLQDSGVDIEGYIRDEIGNRLGRALNEHFTTGTGSGQPSGVVTGATLGVTGATGQTDSVTYDDLVDLQSSVDMAYQGRAQWMLHQSTLGALKKLKDSNNNPIWQTSVAAGAPDTILGKPYIVNNDVAEMAASAKSILYGDFYNYKIRDVQNALIIRANERFIDSGLVGFFLFSRHDGHLVDAGTHPIKYYQNAAS